MVRHLLEFITHHAPVCIFWFLVFAVVFGCWVGRMFQIFKIHEPHTIEYEEWLGKDY